jgi:hypothetical protein
VVVQSFRSVADDPRFGANRADQSERSISVPSHDRADKLATLDDLWSEVREHITFGYFTEAELEAKFRKGEAEHGRDWLRMTRERLQAEINAELMDLTIYQAMIDARWPDQDDEICGVPA